MLVPWIDVDQAFAEAESLRRQVDAVFGGRGLDGRHGLIQRPRAVPRFVEDESGYTLSLDLPGVQPDEITLTSAGVQLTLQAGRAEAAPEGYTLRHRERHDFQLSHTWRLPPDVDPEQVDARFSDGVLSVHLPKVPEAAPRQIEVKH